MDPTILIGTWADGLFAVSGASNTHEVPGQCISHLAHESAHSCLAILGQHTLCRRSPDGTWGTLATTVDIELSCVLACHETILVGTDDARLLRLDAQAKLNPIKAFDRTAGRDTWFAGSAIVNGQRLGPPLGIRSLSASADGHSLFANVHVGGIPRSLDQGQSWHPTIDIHCGVHEVRCHPTNPRIVAAASAVGLGLSWGAGSTWTIESAGLHATHALAIAFSGDDVILSASADPFASPGKVYHRPLKPSGTLRPLEGGFPDWTPGKVDTHCIAAKQSNVAVVDSGGNMYLSTDFGATWSQHPFRFPTPSSILIV
ncbi:MAG: hypothetical protein FJW36_07110 [Acidobacteria bacterium]|nr:hypothetical protein [Acidobacteriota bacterium]